jgi:hypothetical protein
MIIVVFSLSLLVLMAGLMFLNHVKKEGLGLVSKITAYLSIAFSTVVIIGGIVGMCMMGCHGKCGKGGHGKCHSEMRHHGGGCGGGSCDGMKEEHHVIIKDGYCTIDGKKMKQEECMVDGKCVIKEDCEKGGECCEEGGKKVEKEVTVTVEK